MSKGQEYDSPTQCQLPDALTNSLPVLMQGQKRRLKRRQDGIVVKGSREF